MDDKSSKSSKLMKMAIVVFAIGFEAVTFGMFMRLVYMNEQYMACLLYTSPSPRDRTRSRMPSSA